MRMLNVYLCIVCLLGFSTITLADDRQISLGGYAGSSDDFKSTVGFSASYTKMIPNGVYWSVLSGFERAEGDKAGIDDLTMIPLQFNLGLHFIPYNHLSPYSHFGLSLNLLNDDYNSPVLGAQAALGMLFRFSRDLRAFCEFEYRYIPSIASGVDYHSTILRAGLGWALYFGKKPQKRFDTQQKKRYRDERLKRRRIRKAGRIPKEYLY